MCIYDHLMDWELWKMCIEEEEVPIFLHQWADRFSDCLLQSLGSYLLWRMFHTLWCARMQTSAIKAIHGLHVAHPILLLPPAPCHHGGGSSLPRNWSATMKHQCTIRTVLAEISGTVGGHSVVLTQIMAVSFMYFDRH